MRWRCPGLAAGPEVAVVLGSLLGDPLGMGDPVADLGRYALIARPGTKRCWCIA